MRAVLGVSAYHGDAAAALVVDGRLVAAVEEERFTRIKHWAGFPRQSVLSCLAVAGLAPREVDRFAIGRDPRANAWRKALFGARAAPHPRLVVDRLRHRRRVGDAAGAMADALGLDRAHVATRMSWVEHHPAHLASAFYVSPFEEAAVCALDGFGDFVSTSSAVGRGATLAMGQRVYFPHSLGMLYLAVTQYLGFPRYGDEYKVMALAAYGRPDLAPELRRVLRLVPDGGFELDLAFFRHAADGARMTWDGGEPHIEPVYTPRLPELLGPARDPQGPVEPRHEAIAASLQAVFEDAAFHVLRALHRRARSPRLCLAGGCALNSVMNGKIRQRTPFREVYVQPAAADDGTALGAAFAVWHRSASRRSDFVMDHAYWGPEFGSHAVQAAIDARAGELARAGFAARPIADPEHLTARVAQRIADGQVVGWFQGRMEWGARALGNRSIVADPRRRDMREIINAKVKRREAFRPLAPSILDEALDDFFVGAVPDPFMVQVQAVRPEKREVIPAVTHVDGTARVHAVTRHANALYWQLLKAFEKLTGVPVLLNTSFNESEPIVHRPEDALDCFLRTRMDALVLGHTLVAPVTTDPCAS
jgi:carbamoyltransferase